MPSRYFDPRCQEQFPRADHPQLGLPPASAYQVPQVLSSRRSFLQRNLLGVGAVVLSGAVAAAADQVPVSNSKSEGQNKDGVPLEGCCIQPCETKGPPDWDPVANMGGTANNNCTSGYGAFNILGRWDEATPVFASNFTFGASSVGAESGTLADSDVIDVTLKLEIFSWASTASRIICNGVWVLRDSGGVFEWSEDKSANNNSECVPWTNADPCAASTVFTGNADAWVLSQLKNNDLRKAEFGIYFLAENMFTAFGGAANTIQCSVGAIRLTATPDVGDPVIRYPKSVCLVT